MPFGMTRLDLGHVQHLVHQACQALGFGHDDAHELLALGGGHAGVVLHEFGQRTDGSERRAQLVRHRRHEVVLEPVQALQLLVGGAQFGGGLLQRARLALQRPRIGADLRGLVQNAQHVFGRERFFFGHRGHQRTGRCTAHGTGQLGFDKLHQPGVGPQRVGMVHAHALRIAVKKRLRLGAAQKTLAQAQQVLRVGPPAPEHGARSGRTLQHIDKQQGLAGLAARRRAPQRHPDIRHHIGQHAPEQRMREAVEPLQAKQLLGPQPGHAPGPVGDEAHVEPARLGNGGQHERVGPHHKARQQTRECAQAGSALPVHAAQHHGCKLRHGGKADEPDADQRVRLTREVKVHIAQHQHAQNGGAPDAQQKAREVLPAAAAQVAPAQQQGQHQLVADHGGDRHGLHDDHARGRRQPPDKRKQRQRVLPGRQRQRQHKILGIALPRPEIQQAAQCNGQHEQVDEQHVERKHPDRAAQVVFAHVFHHHHLELAGQKHHREH